MADSKLLKGAWDTTDGYKVNGVTVINSSGKVVESAGIEISNGDTFKDNNGNEALEWGVVSSAVNHIKLTNAATGNAPIVEAAGTNTNIDIDLTPKGTGNVSVNGGRGITSSVANGYVPFYKALVKNNITAGTGGAIPITNYYTTVNTDADDDAFTLADGDIIGQIKRIQLIADGGGDAVITPANFVDGTTITMADAGDYTILIWNGTGWTTLEDGNTVDGVSAPVIA